MGGTSIQQMADRVAELIGSHLKVRGAGLAAKLKRGGRGLPRRVRQAAARLAAAAEQAQNPRLMIQLDMEKVAADYDTCLRHLGELGAGERRVGALLDFGARLALIFLVVAALLLGVLYWRGFLGGV